MDIIAFSEYDISVLVEYDIITLVLHKNIEPVNIEPYKGEGKSQSAQQVCLWKQKEYLSIRGARFPCRTLFDMDIKEIKLLEIIDARNNLGFFIGRQ